MAREVTSLGATKLPKWDLAAHQQREQRAMGVREAPHLKTPLKMLRGMRAKNDMRRERTESRARDSGLQVKSAKRKKRESRESRPSSGGEDVGLDRGRSGDGLLRIGRRTEERLQRGERQMSMAKRLRR